MLVLCMNVLRQFLFYLNRTRVSRQILLAYHVCMYKYVPGRCTAEDAVEYQVCIMCKCIVLRTYSVSRCALTARFVLMILYGWITLAIYRRR